MSVKVCKNKMLLSFLSVLLVVQLVTSSFFVPRVNAALPLAAPLAAALGSLMIDTAIDMGIRFVDEKAKTDFKNTAVNDIWSKYGDNIKDLKPTKKNAGKWLLEIPKWLTGVAIDYVADKAFEIEQIDKNRRTRNKEIFDSIIDYDVNDPLYNTGISIQLVAAPSDGYTSSTLNKKYFAYLTEWLDIKIKPDAYAERSELAFAWRGDFSNGIKTYIKGGFSGTLYFFYSSSNTFENFIFNTKPRSDDTTGPRIFGETHSNSLYSSFSKSFVKTNRSQYKVLDGLPLFEAYLKKMEESHAKIFYGDGMLATAGYEAYLNFPNKTSDGKTILYKPEAIEKIDHPAIKPIELEFEFKDLNLVLEKWNEINEGDQFDWEVIEKEVNNQVTNNTFNTTNHTINNYNKIDYNTVINNYYTTENEIVIADKDKEDDDKGTENGEIEIENGDVKIDEADIEINDAVIEIEDDVVINVGDGAVINIEDVDDGFFDKLVGVFVPDDFTFVEQQVKRLMKLINDKLPTADLQDMFNSIFVASEKNPLEDLDIEISSLGLRFDFPDVDDDWIVILKRVVTAVVVLYTLVYVYRRVFGSNGVMER